MVSLYVDNVGSVGFNWGGFNPKRVPEMDEMDRSQVVPSLKLTYPPVNEHGNGSVDF